MRKINFSAGPAALPENVLKQVQSEFLDWQGQGASILEVPHRGDAAVALLKEARDDLRTLLEIPTDFHLLFVHGGGRGQFASIPLNLLGKNSKASYLLTGHWSKAAAEEAKLYGDISIAANLNEAETPWCIPEKSTWSVPRDASYLYYCENETLTGVEFQAAPDVSIPVVADMTSSILSKPIDWSRHALIHAGMQKNIGPTGLSVVILHKDYLSQAMPITPSIFHYKNQVAHSSGYNTLPMFNVYVAGLVFKALIKQGGIKAVQAINKRKAEKLYAAIDGSGFYKNNVDKSCRSTMNVTFHLPTEKLEKQFLRDASEQGLINLAGHRTVGGVRASIYNAMPESAVDGLIEFMEAFIYRATHACHPVT